MPINQLDENGLIHVHFGSSISNARKNVFKQGLKILGDYISSYRRAKDYYSLFGYDMLSILSTTGTVDVYYEKVPSWNTSSSAMGYTNSITKNVVLNDPKMIGKYGNSASAAVAFTLAHELGHWANITSPLNWFGRLNPEYKHIIGDRPLFHDSDGPYGYGAEVAVFGWIW